MIIPIRTESPIRRKPVVNYWLIGVNVFLFVVLHERFGGAWVAALKLRYLSLYADQPALHQFFTYQFLHGDVWHLLGNMLFLWVFGNSVNAKMGHFAYLLFYLAGGVFAAWGYAAVNPSPIPLIGASGAIAAITTAYLVLFPRSRVTVMVWFFFFIHFFEWPAMMIIGLKIILWDNVVAPSLGGGGSMVAYGAHIAGYIFGFGAALTMLLIRAVPRDQFDILAIWKRWHRRREIALVSGDGPPTPGRASRPPTAGEIRAASEEQDAHDARLDATSALRARIAACIERGDTAAAAALYEQLVALDPQQCLSERAQLEVARAFYASGRFPQAAAAFSRCLACYTRVPDAADIRLLLGIIYARDLGQYELAEQHLTQSLGDLTDGHRRAQCDRWLGEVRAALGRPEPEPGHS
ncbi:MAG: rhomboid family intramembrane serine protease [Phycisphaerae bacterium]